MHCTIIMALPVAGPQERDARSLWHCPLQDTRKGMHCTIIMALPVAGHQERDALHDHYGIARCRTPGKGCTARSLWHCPLRDTRKGMHCTIIMALPVAGHQER